jgi:tRNA pseudouridine38-40 synthase
MRRVDQSGWRREDEVLIYHVEASSFLRHMVRTMVGAMVEVGRRRIDAKAVQAILAGRERAAAPAAAPPHGLFLMAVHY